MSGGDFWTRRKAAVAAEEVAEREAVLAEEFARERVALEEKPDEEVLAELGLKDPDSLEVGDDFSAYLKAAVPERLRRRALRKLWLSNPVLANVDNLVDYGEDFTDAAMVVENMQTAYQVGKGMLKHLTHTAPETPETTPDEEDESLLMAEAEPVEAAATDENEITEEPVRVQAEEEETVTPAPRRMRFEFS